MRDLKPAFGPCDGNGSASDIRSTHRAGGAFPATLTCQRRRALDLGPATAMSAALVASVALLAGLATGCGMSQLERHATAAGALHAATGVAADIVDHGAREAAARAGDADELQAALVPWRRAEAVQHLAAAAVDVYVAEVLRAAVEAAGDEPDMSRALAALSEALSLYRALADLLSTYGVELPGVARVLAAVGGAL